MESKSAAVGILRKELQECQCERDKFRTLAEQGPLHRPTSLPFVKVIALSSWSPVILTKNKVYMKRLKNLYSTVNILYFLKLLTTAYAALSYASFLIDLFSKVNKVEITLLIYSNSVLYMQPASCPEPSRSAMVSGSEGTLAQLLSRAKEENRTLRQDVAQLKCRLHDAQADTKVSDHLPEGEGRVWE